MPDQNFVINQDDLITVTVSDPVPVGVVGFLGPTGSSATVAVGTVSTGNPGSSASVVNVGTASNAVLNFTIPKGDTGAAGSGSTTDSINEGSTNLYFTSTRAAAAAPVQSVDGRTGAVVLAKADVGLGSVDNTADAAKSVLSAAKLATARTINGVAFDGTANITVADSTKEPTITAGTTSQYFRGDKTFQTLDKSAVGLSNVDNTADVDKPVSTATQTALNAKEATANRNVANGYAGLDASGLVPATLLPSYVDDVLEYVNLAGFPVSGETGKIYVDKATSKIFRWSGSTYVEISPSPGSTDSVTEGSTNLYFTNARAAAAAPVQSVAGRSGAVTLAKADVGLSNVDNTSDATRDAAATALTNKTSVTSTGAVTGSTLVSTVATGTAPLTVASTTQVANLNASTVGGLATAYGAQGSTLAVRDSNANITARNFAAQVDTTATAAGTTTLTVANGGVQVFTGSTTQTVLLPTGTSVTAGWRVTVINQSTGTVTVRASDSTLVVAVPASYGCDFTALVGTPTTSGHWRGAAYFNSGIVPTSANSLAVFVQSTTNAIGVGTIELGHASDTTLSRSAAGVLAVEGVDVVTTTGAQALTNKTSVTSTGAVTGSTLVSTVAQGTAPLTVTSSTMVPNLNAQYVGTIGASVLVTLTGTQTLTNKTLTSPSITTPTGITKSDVGLSNVTNAAQEVLTAKNVANGYAGLDAAGLIPAGLLPSYVDDVLEYAAYANFPGTGETGKIYVDKATSKIYRWSGSVYVEIAPSPGSTDSVTEGATNLYFTAARASAAAPVQSVAGKTGAVSLVKADVGLGSVDNTADSAKSVLSASKLTSPVTINGVSFDGSAAITVADSTKEPAITAGTTSQYYRGDKSFQTLDKSAVGLSNVDNTSDAGKPISTATATALAAKEATANKNAVNGYAGLDASGLVPATLLPSYVDDVLEYTNYAGFPNPGVTGKIYVALDTSQVYRWSGSAYVQIVASPGTTDSITEGATNLFFTTARASAAAPVQSVAGRSGAVTLAKADVGLGSVDNTADSAKAVLSATKLATARAINGVSFDGTADIVVSKPRVGTTASSATPSIDCGLYDQYTITALAAAITGVTVTGTPTDGQKLMVRIKDNGTARAITWGASFSSSGVATLLATTVASKTHMVGFIYDSAAAKWVCAAVDATGY